MNNKRAPLLIGIVALTILISIFVTIPLYTPRRTLPICNRFDMVGPTMRHEYAGLQSIATVGSTVLIYLVAISLCDKPQHRNEAKALVVAFITLMYCIAEVNFNKNHPGGVPGERTTRLHSITSICLVLAVVTLVVCMVNLTQKQSLHFVTAICTLVIAFMLNEWRNHKDWVIEHHYGWDLSYYTLVVMLCVPLYVFWKELRKHQSSNQRTL